MSHPTNRPHHHRRAQSSSSALSASTAQFFIPDSSPFFSYSSPPSGWVPGYALQSDGYDDTLHLTSSSNSTISFNISATAFTLLVPSISNCSATVSINGSSPTPACPTDSSAITVPGLPEGVHQVTWSTGLLTPDEQVVFWGISGTRSLSSGFSNLTIDDTYADAGPVALSYQGTWDHWGGGNETNAYNGTLSVTNVPGASVTISGPASAVYLYGSVGPNSGQASVALNGHVVENNLNLTYPWSMDYQLLWYRTGLDPSITSNVSLTNLVEGKLMSLDFVVVTGNTSLISALTLVPPPAFSSTLQGRLVLCLVLPLGIILVIALTLLHSITRRRRRARLLAHTRRSSSPPDFRAEQLASSDEKDVSPQVTMTERDERDTRDTRDGRSLSPDEEIFVSYEQGRGQRLDERWNSPTSPDEWSTASRFSDRLGPGPANPAPSSSDSSPAEEYGTRHRPFQSIIGRWSILSGVDEQRRTKPPAYSPPDNSTYSSPSDTRSDDTHTDWSSANAEKGRIVQAQTMAALAGPSYPPSAFGSPSNLNLTSTSSSSPNSPPRSGRSRSNRFTARESTVAPSSIISVFGAPPSERRDSMITYEAGSSGSIPPFDLPPFTPSPVAGFVGSRMEEEHIAFTQTVPAYALGPLSHFGIAQGGGETIAHNSSRGRVGVGEFFKLGVGLGAEKSHESGQWGETKLSRNSAQHATAKA
ncbi:hypothetical protein EHS25_000254 [Saitozyma podzolica]|uniref:Uncharacterized protein n=1 Tax=Saitozyma podzolica TaxID=1890683 RepID=A0A427YVK5_9TREE|nr:hypothetical protein EHS25_000254 [Saitozyma podzolica]